MNGVESRRLPFVIHPLPDEPFGSWFETMTAALGTTSGDMAHALGLRVRTQGPLGSTSWSTRLDEHELRNLERATGLARPVLRATTREGFAANAVQYDRRGAISLFSPISGSSGWFCPECLHDSGGRWRLTWQFPFAFACVRHRRLLVELCPSCGKPPHRTALPHRLVPTPGSCRNRVGHLQNGRVRYCGNDLRHASGGSAAADPDILDAQRRIMRVLSADRIAAGIWASGPQPAAYVLADLRLLAGYARHRPAEGHTRDAEPHSPASSRAAKRGSAYVVAWQAVHEPRLLAELLGQNETDHTPYSGLSPQLQSYLAAARGGKRRATFLLRTAFVGADPAVRAAKIPALLWAEWTDRLAPQRMDRAIAGAALSAAVLLSGSGLTHAAALQLLDRDAPSKRVTNVMRALGAGDAEADTVTTILRLAEYLDNTTTPIDYSRRRSLDYSHLLTPAEWEQIAITENVHAGAPRRALLARAYLHRVVSGNRARHFAPLQSAAVPVTDAEVDRFARNAPARVRAALIASGGTFLRRLGIDEPPTWQPEPALLRAVVVGTTSGAIAQGAWKPRRPARGGPGGENAARIRDAHAAGLSIRGAAEQLNLSRQTISRTLAAQGVRVKPGRATRFHSNSDWLREQRALKRSAADIARDIGCSPTTVYRQLRAHDID